MILDILEHADGYAPALGPRFQDAFAYLRQLRPADFSPGRHQIDAERLFAIHTDYDTHPEAEALLEAHRRYADVMLLLDGAEVIAWKPTSQLGQLVQSYTAETDAALAKLGQNVSRLVLTPGSFVVLLPGDAHAPQLQLNGPEAVRKIIVKVQLEP